MAQKDPGDGAVSRSSYIPIKSGYVNLPLIPFLGAVLIVGAPIVTLNLNRPDWTWKYIFLIMLTMTLYYQGALGRFSQFFSTAVKPLKV